MEHGGRGRPKPTTRELDREERKGSAVRLSVSYVGHNAREKAYFADYAKAGFTVG